MALLHAHAHSLQQRRRHLLQRLVDGVAPADYAHCQTLLAMCDAALRVLHTLSPATAVVPTGPAAALPRRAVTT